MGPPASESGPLALGQQPETKQEGDVLSHLHDARDEQLEERHVTRRPRHGADKDRG